jgi:anti-anti-sigma regulatory factor
MEADAMRPTLTCTLESNSPVAMLRLVGVLDLGSVPTVRTALHKALAGQPRAIVVDLAGLRVNDDLMLTAFTAFARTAAAWPGCALLLCAANGALAVALERAAVSRTVSIYRDRAQALDAADHLMAPRRFERPLPLNPGACSIARDEVSTACRRWHVADVIDDAVIVVTELVANAVRHACGDIRLSVVLSDYFLHLSVRDGSAEPPRLARPDPDSGEGGRGLRLVDAFADGWGCIPIPPGKIVWATLRIRR